MRLIEFKVKEEGETVSDAYLTFGMFRRYKDRHKGLYLSFCVPAWKMVRNIMFNEVTGWYGYRITIGYYVREAGSVTPIIDRYWSLIKQISIVTEEQRLNEAAKR